MRSDLHPKSNRNWTYLWFLKVNFQYILTQSQDHMLYVIIKCSDVIYLVPVWLNFSPNPRSLQCIEEQRSYKSRSLYNCGNKQITSEWSQPEIHVSGVETKAECKLAINHVKRREKRLQGRDTTAQMSGAAANTNLGLFKISFSTFWCPAPKCTETGL